VEAGAQILLTLSGLILVALAAAAAGERVGAPLLLVFLAVGVLAGPEGPGGLVVEDPDAAFTAASAALAVILVDGGLRTRPETLAMGLRPGLALAVGGTALTAAITALAAATAFGLGWREALLIGAVVSSTDAAAVFALIGGGGARVQPRLAATLEVESGVNDPVAVFLTVTLAGALAAETAAGPLGFIGSFVWQAVGGVVIGGGAGAALALVTPRLKLTHGLLPILVLAGGLFAFAFAQALGASGFLAAYVFGVVHARGDRHIVEAEARALDGFAWLAQLALFLILGLLAAPSHIVAVAVPALAVALALTLIARPLAAFVCLAPFRFSLQEQAFAAWAGLRGATPIFLGLIPVAIGTPNANLYFSVAFVAVGLSLVAQGWTTPLAARLLQVSGEAEAGEQLRIGALRGVAVAAAVAASVTAAVVLARVAAPPPALTVSPASVAELDAALDRSSAAIVTALPPDWTTITDQTRRTTLFVETMRPLVEAENARIREERSEVEAFAEAEARGQPLSLAGQARRDLLARAYGVRYEDIDELLRRVDVVPVDLAVAQAALVTGWGTSAAALEDNSLFGRRPSGNGVERFPTLLDSVADYASALNSRPDFAAFRDARAAARAEGREPTAEELVAFVAPFAREGEGFAANVRRMIDSLPGRSADGTAGR
jgi:cell volume regulation protein A